LIIFAALGDEEKGKRDIEIGKEMDMTKGMEIQRRWEWVRNPCVKR